MDTAMEMRIAKRNKLISYAGKYSVEISRFLSPMCSVVIGSVARGDFNDSSDIDVIIISDRIPEDYHKRGELLYEYVFDAIEPKGYTINEFKLIYAKGNPIATEAVDKGIVVYDDGIWKDVIENINP